MRVAKVRKSSGSSGIADARSPRPQLQRVSQQMKAWSSALAAEVSEWPKLSAKSFFGFTALRRGETIFGALPRTRAFSTPNSLAFKLQAAGPALQKRLQSDPRVGIMRRGNSRWFTFEMSSDSDLHDVLDWLLRAYQAAGKAKKTR
jgi:hypothetical protein